MAGEEWLGVWTNELHADYLAHDRLGEARARAARQAILEGCERGNGRRRASGWGV